MVLVVCLWATPGASAKAKSCGLMWKRQANLTLRVVVSVRAGDVTCAEARHRFAEILSAHKYAGWRCRRTSAHALTCSLGDSVIREVTLTPLHRQHRICGTDVVQSQGHEVSFRVWIVWGGFGCSTARRVMHHYDSTEGKSLPGWYCTINVPKYIETCDGEDGPAKIQAQQLGLDQPKPPPSPPPPPPSRPGLCGQVTNDLGGGIVLFAQNIRGYSHDCSTSRTVAGAFLRAIGCGLDETCAVYADDQAWTCFPEGAVRESVYQSFDCQPANKVGYVSFKYAQFT
jgi:hypothetical protein